MPREQCPQCGSAAIRETGHSFLRFGCTACGKRFHEAALGPSDEQVRKSEVQRWARRASTTFTQHFIVLVIVAGVGLAAIGGWRWLHDGHSPLWFAIGVLVAGTGYLAYLVQSGHGPIFLEAVPYVAISIALLCAVALPICLLVALFTAASWTLALYPVGIGVTCVALTLLFAPA